MFSNTDISVWEIIESLGILLWEKDINSVYTYGNDLLVKTLNFKNQKSLIDKTDYDIPCDMAELAEIFRQSDQHVLAVQKPLRFLEVLRATNNVWKMFIVTKSPCFNEEGFIIGTSGHAVDITNSFFKIGHVLMKENSMLTSRATKVISYPVLNEPLVNKPTSKKALTKRQTEVLFFLLRNKTAKEIARFLNIRHRTVEDHIAKIKEKFNCPTKSCIFDEAVERGFLNVIPENFFTTQCSIFIGS